MENWKDIPGYEGLYQASTEGRIRTCEGKITASARFPTRVWKQRIMKQKIHKNKKGRADARVCLWKDGKEKTHLVSRLVAKTWCDGYSEGLTVNHKNGQPLDNRAENLEWCSLTDNIRHAFDFGLVSSQLTTTLISDSGEELSFKSMSAASKFLGRSKSYVSNAIAKGHIIRDTKNVAYSVHTAF